MATNTQKEFRKQMKALAKEGKVPKSNSRKTVRFIETRTLGLGAGTFLVIVAFNAISGLFGAVTAQPEMVYESNIVEVANAIDQRESELIQRMTQQVESGNPFSQEDLTTIRSEINALRDQLPAISEIQGAVSIENRQLDQIDTILLNVSEMPITQKGIDAINNAITIYNGLSINSEHLVELVK